MNTEQGAGGRAKLRRAGRWLAAGALGLLLGVAAGLLDPRGTVTAVQAMVLLAAGVVTGAVAARLCRRRAAFAVAGLGYLAGSELMRWGVVLPSAGAPRLDTAVGVLAFALGRLLPWVLAWLAMAVGAAWSTWPGARPAPARRLVGAGLVALVSLAILWPASAPAVAGAPGGGVSELLEVELGGHSQWVEVRGARPDLPVLLYLSGGPGQSDLPFSRALLEPLTSDFLVAAWDQRGTGKSYPGLDAATLTLDRAVSDTVELARRLADRYGQEKVYLLGESWGSLLGVLAVQQAPDAFHAYVASGQMVDPHETDAGIYTDLKALALRTGDAALLAQLDRLGPPPYRSPLDYGEIMFRYPLLEGEYTPPAAYLRRAEAAGAGPMGVFGQEYTLVEKVNVLRGLLDMFSVMYPQLRDVDLRERVPDLEVPVVVMAGGHEIAARTGPAREWFDALEAPSKEWLDYADGGHAVAFEHADDLHRVLLRLAASAA